MPRDHLIFDSVMAAKRRFQRFARSRRMLRMKQMLALQGGERVLDLGGSIHFWDGLDVPLDITILNLPEFMPDPMPSHHDITLIAGDATAVDLPDMSFDLVVSNSVIEHVGEPDRQRAMAQEARRLAPRYWVQTPSIWFPIEAHTNMPFWWFWPRPLQERAIRKWRRTLPDWCAMVEGTTVIRHADLQAMFPDARIWTERLAGIPKSHIAWRG